MPQRLSVKQLKLLEQHMYILKKLATVSPKDRKAILKNAPPQLFQALNLVFKLVSDVNLPKKQAGKIKKHKRALNSIREMKTSAIKRRLQHQSGGFLPGLISAALPLLGSLLGKIF